MTSSFSFFKIFLNTENSKTAMKLDLTFFHHCLSLAKKVFQSEYTHTDICENYEEESIEITCPYCGSEYFDDIKTYFDESLFKVLSRCLNCGRYFICEYVPSNVYGIEDNEKTCYKNRNQEMVLSNQRFPAS